MAAIIVNLVAGEEVNGWGEAEGIIALKGKGITLARKSVEE